MGAKCTRFCKNNIGGGVFHIERCWGVFTIQSSNPTCVSLHGGGGMLWKKFLVLYIHPIPGERGNAGNVGNYMLWCCSYMVLYPAQCVSPGLVFLLGSFEYNTVQCTAQSDPPDLGGAPSYLHTV